MVIVRAAKPVKRLEALATKESINYGRNSVAVWRKGSSRIDFDRLPSFSLTVGATTLPLQHKAKNQLHFRPSVNKVRELMYLTFETPFPSSEAMKVGNSMTTLDPAPEDDCTVALNAHVHTKQTRKRKTVVTKQTMKRTRPRRAKGRVSSVGAVVGEDVGAVGVGAGVGVDGGGDGSAPWQRCSSLYIDGKAAACCIVCDTATRHGGHSFDPSHQDARNGVLRRADVAPKR